jgi:predicted component of type VI protein secretion system
MRASLTVLSGPFVGQKVAVSRGKLLIGREVDCHLRPDNPLISRHHCALLLDDFTLRVRDLGSRNGTFVNEHRIGIAEVVLLHGDVVTVGDMTCKVEFATEPPTGIPAGLPQLLEATGVFDGDTVQAKSAAAAAPPPTEPPAPSQVP